MHKEDATLRSLRERIVVVPRSRFAGGRGTDPGVDDPPGAKRSRRRVERAGQVVEQVVTVGIVEGDGKVTRPGPGPVLGGRALPGDLA